MLRSRDLRSAQDAAILRAHDKPAANARELDERIAKAISDNSSESGLPDSLKYLSDKRNELRHDLRKIETRITEVLDEIERSGQTITASVCGGRRNRTQFQQSPEP